MIVSAAVAVAAGVSAVRWVVRRLASKLLSTSPINDGRRRILPAVGYVAALASLPFALFLGVTVGGTLGGGLGDTLVYRYGAEIGVGLGLGAITLIVALIAAILGMLLCALLLRAFQRRSPGT
jgi:hypothetical protein